MAGPLSVRGAKATLLISLTMSVLGFTGAANGLAVLRMEPAYVQADPGVPEDGAAAAAELATLLARSPLLKGWAVANLLSSALLVVASFTFTARRRTALWWGKQALLASVAFTAGSIALYFWFASANDPGLSELLARLANAEAEMRGQPPPPPSEVAPSLVIASMFSCGSGLLLGVYALLARGLRSEDVRAFVMRETG